jgi:hypothetical protein
MPSQDRIDSIRAKIKKRNREELSTLRKQDSVIAVLCSDIHLSKEPPRARKKEPDWFNSMAYTLKQVSLAAERYNVPILCAGDIFDYWGAEPELVNFAISHLPKMYAIPGQHDLPLHNIKWITRSAFWTMVLVGKIVPIMHSSGIPIENNIVLHGFPFGAKLAPLEKKTSKRHVALCHEYFWDADHTYSLDKAPKNQESQTYRTRVKGYHAVVFGDNHKGFKTTVGKTEILNCGALMRRKSDDEHNAPQIGLLCASGQIIIHKLNTSREMFTTLSEENVGIRKMLKSGDVNTFISELYNLRHTTLDFLEALKESMDRKFIKNEVRMLIMNALENKDDRH